MNLGFHVSNLRFHALNLDCYGSSNLVFYFFLFCFGFWIVIDSSNLVLDFFFFGF